MLAMECIDMVVCAQISLKHEQAGYPICWILSEKKKKKTKSVRNFVDQCATWQSRPIATPNHFDALFFSVQIYSEAPCH